MVLLLPVQALATAYGSQAAAVEGYPPVLGDPMGLARFVLPRRKGSDSFPDRQDAEWPDAIMN